MSTLTLEIKNLRATAVRLDARVLAVELSDSRSLSVPLAWFPRLLAGTRRECANWRLIGGGEGIHWPDLDEDISVEALLAGRGSMESRASLTRWLRSRQKRLSKRSGRPGRLPKSARCAKTRR